MNKVHPLVYRSAVIIVILALVNGLGFGFLGTWCSFDRSDLKKCKIVSEFNQNGNQTVLNGTVSTSAVSCCSCAASAEVPHYKTEWCQDSTSITNCNNKCYGYVISSSLIFVTHKGSLDGHEYECFVPSTKCGSASSPVEIYTVEERGRQLRPFTSMLYFDIILALAVLFVFLYLQIYNWRVVKASNEEEKKE